MPTTPADLAAMFFARAVADDEYTYADLVMLGQAMAETILTAEQQNEARKNPMGPTALQNRLEDEYI